MSQPSRPTVIAVNQTAGDIFLTDMGATVPASGTLALQDFYYLHEIQSSKSLFDAITANQILIDDGVSTLTKPQSINFVTGVASAQDGQKLVTGPASSTATQVPKFSGTDGKALVASTVTIDASNNLVMPGTKIQGLATPTASTDAVTKAYADALASGVSWQQPVITQGLNTPPGSPVSGDRYVVGTAPTGAWSANADAIAEWSGVAWVFTTPQDGFALVAKDTDKQWIYSGTAWIEFGSTVNHGSLLGLANDDHLQYLLVSGTRAMTGGLNMGGQSITNVNLVDGVDVSSHAARHLPGGADALSFAAAGSISVGDTAAEGTALTVARADHVHGLAAPAAPADVTRAAASAGSSANVARADHKHDISTAAPAATSVASSPSAGTASSMARSDHVHQSNTAPVNVTKATAAIGTSGEPARADHKHDVATAAPSTGIGAGNTEGASTSLARADHDHTLRESGGQNLTIGAIADGDIIRRTGTTIAGGAGRIYAPGATDPVSPAPNDGDTYFNTVLHMLMYYDAARAKWLSVEASEIIFGRSGNTAAGTFYRGIDSIVTSSTVGILAEYKGTVVSIAYTRSDSDSATFELCANGTGVASLLSAATTGSSLTLNGDFNQNDVLAMKNQTGGNTTADVSGKVRFRWRV